MARLFDVRCPACGPVAAGLTHTDAVTARGEHWTGQHPVAARKWRYRDEVMPMPSRPSHIQIALTTS